MSELSAEYFFGKPPKSPVPQATEENKLKEPIILVYMEDDQGYTTTAYEFKTNCPSSVEDLGRLSYEVTGAGRFSTTFNSFSNLLLDRGFSCDLIKNYGVVRDQSNKDVFEGLKKFWDLIGLKIVWGATGNY